MPDDTIGAAILMGGVVVQQWRGTDGGGVGRSCHGTKGGALLARTAYGLTWRDPRLWTANLRSLSRAPGRHFKTLGGGCAHGAESSPLRQATRALPHRGRLRGADAGARGDTRARALVGAVIGVFAGPLGLLFGPVIGAVAGEFLRRGDLEASTRSGLGALVGLAIGIAANLGVAIVMVALFLWWAWRG